MLIISKSKVIDKTRIQLEYNKDVASLRRGMIEMKLMDRQKGVYWRIMENE